LSLTDARYMNAMKIFLQGIPAGEYQAHRNFAHLARFLNGPGARFASLCQSMDELRHAQTEIHTLSHYNKYFGGMHDWAKMSDRVWYLSVPKSFFDDAGTAGPFEWLIAIGFSFEYLLTNLLFVPFMSGAAFNGDLPTMTFGFSAQSDESRHMTLGLEGIKFMLEQDEDNLPIVQAWLDKWFWRGYRLIALVAGMMDYMLPKRVMSWKEAFELYFEEQMLNGLFKDLEYYGIKPPRDVDWAIGEKDILSHQVYWILYQFSHAAAFTTTIPNAEDQAWLEEAYPETWPIYKSVVWDKAQRVMDSGGRYFNPGLPQLCQVCQIPMGFTEPGDPMTQCQRHSIYEGERYDTCSDGCQWIFEREPEKYVQAWLPVHQIYQGNCGGPTLPDVAVWYGLEPGDGGEYMGSMDQLDWVAWHAATIKEG
jgi:phenol hydroxylase P3 protein